MILSCCLAEVVTQLIYSAWINNRNTFLTLSFLFEMLLIECTKELKTWPEKLETHQNEFLIDDVTQIFLSIFSHSWVLHPTIKWTSYVVQFAAPATHSVVKGKIFFRESLPIRFSRCTQSDSLLYQRLDLIHSLKDAGIPWPSCTAETWISLESIWYNLPLMANESLSNTEGQGNDDVYIAFHSGCTKETRQIWNDLCCFRNGICRETSEALIAPVDDGSGAFTIYFGKVRG